MRASRSGARKIAQTSEMIELPRIASETEFAAWRTRPIAWRPAVVEIARLENIAAHALLPFGTGTNLVIDLDGRSVLKLFPPIYRTQFVSERASLRQLAGRLTVPIPAILAEGEYEGWAWLVLTKLDGVVGSQAWPALTGSEKETILFEIGQTIAEVQSVPPGELSTIEPAWPDFIARQVAGCVERHRRQNLSHRLLSDIGELLSEVSTNVPLDAPPVILTGEWIPENLLLSESGGRWRLAAVIDFGDVMTGWREYDILGPSTFMCEGLRGRVESLFRGYGIASGDCGPAMRRRLLTLMILHRASDLRNVKIDGWEARIGSLADLEDVI